MSWHACALPPAGSGDAFPRRGDELVVIEALAHEVEAPVPAEDHPPWTDDRAWIARWRQAGPALPEREPVVRAWLAAAPSPPLPRTLAALELRRLAREHGLSVAVAGRSVARDEQAEIERLMAAARRVVESPDALVDPAELLLRGEDLS
jgi:hypothetical protein